MTTYDSNNSWSDPWDTINKYDSFYDKNPIYNTKLFYRHINKLSERNRKILKNWFKLTPDGTINIFNVRKKLQYPHVQTEQLVSRARWKLYCEIKQEELHCFDEATLYVRNIFDFLDNNRYQAILSARTNSVVLCPKCIGKGIIPHEIFKNTRLKHIFTKCTKWSICELCKGTGVVADDWYKFKGIRMTTKKVPYGTIIKDFKVND